MTPPVASPYQKVLVLDSTEQNVTTVAYWQKGHVEKVTEPVRAQELQRMITQLLERLSLSFDTLDAVAVLTGPGSYTGIRIGVTTANTIAWLSAKPVLALDGGTLAEAIAKLHSPLPPQTAVITVI